MKKLLILAAALPWCSFAQSEMALVKVPKCEAWKLPKVDVNQVVDAEWHEMDDGMWFTNSVGEKISLTQYCAVLNCAGERAVKPLLDSCYARYRPEAIQKMYETEDDRKDGPFWNNHFTLDKSGKLLKGREESLDELSAWRLNENVGLVLSADDNGRMRIRLYTFVLFDGERWRTIAEFDRLPDPDRMDAILSVWSSPDAVNNVAAMYYNEEAWTHSADDDYVLRLLTVAVRCGSAAACENLALLGKDRGWSKARIERCKRFAEVCRAVAKEGLAPKMELKSIAEWPLLWEEDS